MTKNNSILIKGARVNNLKNIDVEIPRNKLVVITGLSGSGKSSLAFDTLYAEGQRRYVESLSSYARQFLGRMSKPEPDSPVITTSLFLGISTSIFFRLLTRAPLISMELFFIIIRVTIVNISLQR